MTKPRWASYHTSTDSMTRWNEKQRFDKLNDYLWEKRIHHVRERDKHAPYSQEYMIHAVMAFEFAKDHETLKHILEQIDKGVEE